MRAAWGITSYPDREPSREGTAMSPALQIALIAAPSALLATIAIGLALRTRSALRTAVRGLADEVARQGAAIEGLSAARQVPGSVASSNPKSRRDRPGLSVPKGPTLIAVPDLAPPSPGAVAMPADLARRFGAIWDRADSGASAEAIARDTGQPIGQVELILGLRRTRPAEHRG